MNWIVNFLKKPYLAILLTLFVATICFIPSDTVPETDLPFFDKTVHFLAFAALGFSWLGFIPSYWFVFICLSLFAYLVEIVQKLLPAGFNRSFDYYDILADVIGIVIGFGCYKIYLMIVDYLGWD